MRFVRDSFYIKIVAILLSLLFFQSDLFVHAGEGEYDIELESVKNEYISGNYILLIEKLEKLLNKVGEEHRIVRGNFFLLLGAAYEQTGNRENAIENYLIGDLLLDKPEVEGIDLNSLNIFMSTLYGKVINGTRVFEKVSKRKKRRKFPYFAILGAAAVIVAVFLLMKKRTGCENFMRFEQVANEIFDSIEWIEIPAGEFQMGDNHGLGSEDELPVHTVYLDSYKISKFEITYEQFDKYADAIYQRYQHMYYTGSGENHPVVNARWGDAGIFCEWVSEYAGKTVKLPTEAQWEKAARGTGQVIYPWGNSPPDCSKTNYNNCIGDTKPVGSYPLDVSMYGVMDMGGNVSEMVYDSYLADYYSISPLNNPLGPGLYQNSNRIKRGGNWSENDLRTTNRSSIVALNFDDKTGFRIVWID